MKYTLKSGQEIEFNIYGIDCRVLDSYRVKDKDSKIEFLNYLLENYSAFNARTIDSYYKEWKAHNFLYKIGFIRSKTATVDLNIDEGKLRLFIYNLISLFTPDNI